MYEWARERRMMQQSPIRSRSGLLCLLCTSLAMSILVLAPTTFQDNAQTPRAGPASFSWRSGLFQRWIGGHSPAVIHSFLVDPNPPSPTLGEVSKFSWL